MRIQFSLLDLNNMLNVTGLRPFTHTFKGRIKANTQAPKQQH